MDDLVSLLQRIGFSKSEALIYITLIKYGPLSARALSDLSGVPYSKTYSVLNSLANKGFVTVVEGRPKTYKAVSPREAIPIYVKRLVSELSEVAEEAVKRLEEIASDKSRVEERLVMVIRDPMLIAEKVADAIKKSRIYVKLSGPTRLVNRLKNELVDAIKRGVRVYVMSPENPGIPGIERKPARLMGGGLIVDGKEVIILLKEGDSFIALYSDHPSLSVIAEAYYDTLRT